MRALLFLTIMFSVVANAQKTDHKLEKNIKDIVRGFHGDVGVYVKDLRSNKAIAINADSVFPTASIVKIPIMIGVINKINNGELNYHQELIYNDTILYPGVDILGSFKNGEKIELSKVMMLMLTMSDNTASLWLQSLAGTGVAINKLLDSLGFAVTRVNSRTPGREDWRSKYGWGQTTPREIATILEQIYKKQIITDGACDRMLRSLNKNYWDAEALSQIPPYATKFSKNGAVNESRSEVVLVRGKKSNYVFCVSTKNITDTSWKNENEAWQMTRKISNLLWNYFERHNKWQPAPDAAKFN